MSAKRASLALLFLFVALAWMVPSAPALAQATRGTLLGTVTDQSGAALPGVTITATETRTNLSHTTVTNPTGNYTLPNIADGVYNIKAKPTTGSSTSETKFGINVGAGFDFDIQDKVGIFVEGRFHNVFISGSDAKFIPISAGVRFGV